MALINLQKLSLTYGNFPLLDSIDLQIHEGEKICLLGRNGSGKSTMMKIINGNVQPDSGSVIRSDALKTALFTQDVPIQITGKIYDIVMEGAANDGLLHHLDGHDERNIRQLIDKTLSYLSLDGSLSFESLSAGMKRRVLLGKSLVAEPDILLLDEPTNHLDLDSISWLEDFLVKYDKTVFFVTHDRSFMQKIANRIIEIDRGRLFDWKCDYITFLQRKESWLESEETSNALFDKKLAKEEAWIRQGVKARRTRNEGRVRALKKMREERAQRRERQGSVKMEIQKSDPSGKMIIETEDISFGYGDIKIIEGFSTRILRGDKIGIIGPNGCGKSTLIKLLLGEILPDSGFVRSGTRIEIAYFDQLRGTIDPELSVKDNVAMGNEIIEFNGRNRHVVGYLQDFLFSPERIDLKASVLSGGETNRLLLAKLFTRPANFIILDEPTNDLDIETIELLEELLVDFEGTLITVSHDRSFLNNVVSSIYSFDGNAQVNEYVGGYDDYFSQKKQKPDTVGKNKEKTKEQKETKVSEKKKLTFKERKELDSLPSIIEQNEKRKEEIFCLMADPVFYKEEGSKISDLKIELENIEKELNMLYIRWEELESLNNSS